VLPSLAEFDWREVRVSVGVIGSTGATDVTGPGQQDATAAATTIPSVSVCVFIQE